MNKSFIFIFLLIAGASCSEPENPSNISDIYEALAEQKQLYYNVEFSVNNPKNINDVSRIYGSVSLNRSKDSGISSAYFGFNQNHLDNYMQTMYLKNDWIYDLSSLDFDLKDADLINDSLHSPILINPQLLLKIKADSVSIAQNRINEQIIELIFDLQHEGNQFVLVWNRELKKIIEIEYKYDVKSETAYSKKWSFKYLAKSDYHESEKVYKHQNQASQQPFL